MTEAAPVIAIDFGTSRSRVAALHRGKVEIIPNDLASRATASCVAFTDSELLIGEAAKSVTAENDPSKTVYSIKQLIGCSYEETTAQADFKIWSFQVISHQGKPKIQVVHKGEKKSFYPEEIASMILRKLKETAEAFLGTTVTETVITVPSHFNDSQRRAVKDAGAIAGLNALRVLNEPSAAALAYSFQKKEDNEERNVLIFGLGSGSLDLSVVAVKAGAVTVKSTIGAVHLGGNAMDNLMVDRFVKEFKTKYEKDLLTDKVALSRLRSACEAAKECLTTSSCATIALDSLMDGIDFKSTMTKDDFEELNADLFGYIFEHVEEVIEDAGMTKSQVDDIVLFGGSTRIPKVKQMLRDFFNGKEPNSLIDPEEAVVYGAAMKDFALSEIASLSLGVGFGEMSHAIIKRNMMIPATITTVFQSSSDDKRSFSFPVFEGERIKIKHNKVLAKIAVDGASKVEVTFNVEADGLVNVSAVVKESMESCLESSVIIINDNTRLTKEEVDRLVTEHSAMKSSNGFVITEM